MLEGAKVEATIKPATSTGTAASEAARRSRYVWRSSASPGATTAGAADTAAVFHHDDEGLGFTIGNQVVHDEVGTALVASAGFIFAHAVLQIEHREALVGVLIIIRRGVNEAVAGRVAGFGEVVDLPQLAMGHVLERVKVLILGGDFDAATPRPAP
jgi:hypothetical protein